MLNDLMTAEVQTKKFCKHQTLARAGVPQPCHPSNNTQLLTIAHLDLTTKTFPNRNHQDFSQLCKMTSVHDWRERRCDEAWSESAPGLQAERRLLLTIADYCSLG